MQGVSDERDMGDVLAAHEERIAQLNRDIIVRDATIRQLRRENLELSTAFLALTEQAGIQQAVEAAVQPFAPADPGEAVLDVETDLASPAADSEPEGDGTSAES